MFVIHQHTHTHTNTHTNTHTCTHAHTVYSVSQHMLPMVTHTHHCCRSQKRYSKYLMDTLGMLLTMCSLDDQGVRLAANETLNKLVKATYLTHITKIQMTAFNEMKKVCACIRTWCLCVYVLCYVQTYGCTNTVHMCAYTHIHP